LGEVADGFEAPIFGVRVVGQVTTLALEGEDGPLSLDQVGVTSDHTGAWYVATTDSLLHGVEVATGAVTTIAGSGTAGSADGVGDAAEFYSPTAVAISPDGGALFVADQINHRIRRVEVATGEVTTVAGSGIRGSADGVGDAAELYRPVGIAISPETGARYLWRSSATTRSGGSRWRRER